MKEREGSGWKKNWAGPNVRREIRKGKERREGKVDFGLGFLK